MLSPLSTRQTKLTGGVLAHRCRANIKRLFRRIDVEAMKAVYSETHGPWYAEPEFCGKYLDTAMQVYGTTGDEEIRRGAKGLVEAMLAGQRADGYLGTYHPGQEFDSFSIWNHQFGMMGLLSYFEGTGEEAALAGARRAGDYLVEAFLAAEAPDLLEAVNQGIEHSCLIRPTAHLYRATGEARYLKLCEFVVRRWEESNLRLVSAPLRDEHPIFRIGCLKAAEMLICYQGLVELAEATGNADYLRAAEGYWRAVDSQQIGITGNGSVAEYWTMLGNRALTVSNDLHPNENCVAACWMKLSARLLEMTGEAKYADAFERTLYNHLLGAQAVDGSDFSYYQAVEGHKIHATPAGAYSCCRYRGMNLLAHLPRYAVLQSGEGLTVNVYTDMTADTDFGGVPVTLQQRTKYPREGRVEIAVRAVRPVSFALRLRIPAWCPGAQVTVNGSAWTGEVAPGYVSISREWRAEDRVTLELELPVRTVEAVVEERPVRTFLYGPLVLAADSRFGLPVEEAVLREGVELRPAGGRAEGPFPMVQFEAGSGTLVDWASAGSAAPGRDRIRVWIPYREQGLGARV